MSLELSKYENDVRDLLKVQDALTAVDVHLTCKDQMNAALHMSQEIRATPLSAAVTNARATLANVISRLSGEGENATTG